MLGARIRNGAAGLPGLRAAAGRAARRHWLFTTVLIAGLILRVLTQVAYSPALVYIDSDRYLRAFSAQEPLGYLALLWPLQHAGGIAVVAAVQHVIGLAMACAIYAVLIRRGVWRWVAALAVAPVLLDAYQLQAEQTVMPDVMFEALIVAAVTVLLWRQRPAATAFGLAGLALGAAADVRQVGDVLIVPALAFALACCVRWRQRLVQGVLVTAGFAVPVLACMTAEYFVTGHFSTTQRNTYIFYGRAAAAADCATLRLPASERPLCPPRRAVAALGIDGLVNDPAGPLLGYRPPPGQTITAMANRFELAVLTQQPGAVAGAVGHDFLQLFTLTRGQVPGSTPITRWQFQTGYPTYPPLITAGYVARIRPGGGVPSVIRPLAALLRDYQLNGGYTPGPLLSVALVAGLAGACCLGAARREHRALVSACLLTVGTALTVLLVSDAFEFSWRYQLPALVLLPPAGALGFTALTARIMLGRPAWRGRPAAARAVVAPITQALPVTEASTAPPSPWSA